MACKAGGRQKFWHALYSEWWERYPWRLEDDQEPPTNNPEEMVSLALVGPGDDSKKALVEKTLSEVLSFFLLQRIDVDRLFIFIPAFNSMVCKPRGIGK